MFWMCAAFIFTSIPMSWAGDIMDTRQRLSADKLRIYMTHIPPTPKQGSDVIDITVDLTFSYILELNEKYQTLVASGWMDVAWIDARLAWNSSAYRVNKTYYHQKDIWLPDLYVKNSIAEVKAMKDDDMLVTVMSNGSVYWRHSSTYNTKCSEDITFFPFDTQICNVTIALWTFDEAILNIKDDHGTRIARDMNEIWAVRSISKYSNGISEVNVVVVLTRCSAYYTTSLLLPVGIIACLISVVFALPVGNGDRVGLAMTILLALVLFLTMFTEQLPKSSTHSSLFTIYLDLYLFYGAITVGLSILTFRLASLPASKPIPDYILRIMSFRRSPSSMAKNAVDTEVHASVVCRKYPNSDEPSWIDAARVLDNVFLVTFIVLIFSTNIIGTTLMFALNEHETVYNC